VVLTAPLAHEKCWRLASDPHYFGTAVTFCASCRFHGGRGVAAVHCACCSPTAALRHRLYQAALNVFTIIAALSLWKLLGVYAFAIGYTMGACAQVGIGLLRGAFGWTPPARLDASPLARDPRQAAFFVVYCRRPGINITFTRALCLARRTGHGRGAGYCMRGVGVRGHPGEPISNSAAARDRALAEPVPLARAFA